MGDDLPTLTLSTDDLGDGISVVQLIVRSGLASSGKEAKRMIEGNPISKVEIGVKESEFEYAFD